MLLAQQRCTFKDFISKVVYGSEGNNGFWRMLQQPPPDSAGRCPHVWVSTEQWPATLCITQELLCFVLFSNSVSHIYFLLTQCFLLGRRHCGKVHVEPSAGCFFPILSASACLLIFFRSVWLKTEEGLNKHERKLEEMMPLSRCFHRPCLRVCVCPRAKIRACLFSFVLIRTKGT